MGSGHETRRSLRFASMKSIMNTVDLQPGFWEIDLSGPFCRSESHRSFCAAGAGPAIAATTQCNARRNAVSNAQPNPNFAQQGVNPMQYPHHKWQKRSTELQHPRGKECFAPLGREQNPSFRWSQLEERISKSSDHRALFLL